MKLNGEIMCQSWPLPNQVLAVSGHSGTITYDQQKVNLVALSYLRCLNFAVADQIENNPVRSSVWFEFKITHSVLNKNCAFSESIRMWKGFSCFFISSFSYKLAKARRPRKLPGRLSSKKFAPGKLRVKKFRPKILLSIFSLNGIVLRGTNRRTKGRTNGRTDPLTCSSQVSRVHNGYPDRCTTVIWHG